MMNSLSPWPTHLFNCCKDPSEISKKGKSSANSTPFGCPGTWSSLSMTLNKCSCQKGHVRKLWRGKMIWKVLQVRKDPPHLVDSSNKSNFFTQILCEPSSDIVALGEREREERESQNETSNRP